MSDSLRPHESQHARPPCPSPTPGLYSNSCPLSRWCHPATSSSVIPFSSCPQSFPASGSFQMSQLFDQVAKVSEFQLQHQSFQWMFRADFLQDRLVGTTCSPQDFQQSSQTHSSKPSILLCSAFFILQLSQPCMTTRKTIALTRRIFVSKVISLLFKMLSRLVMTECGQLEKGMASHFSILALRTPWTVWKGKGRILKDELPRLVGVQYATGDQWRNNSRKNEGGSQSKKQNKNIFKKYIALKSWPQSILEREILPKLTYFYILVFLYNCTAYVWVWVLVTR